MTDGINKSREKLARMDDLVMDDLAALTDEELLSEAAEEGVDIEAVGRAGREAYERVQIIIGRNRLAIIRNEMARITERVPPSCDRALGRSSFLSILATNKDASAKLTMAARNQLNAKAEEDMDGIIDDFIELDAIPGVKEDKDS
jgi:hypothetical protein